MNTININKPIEYSDPKDFLNEIYKKLGHESLFDKENQLHIAKSSRNHFILNKEESRIIKLNPLENKKLK